MANATGKTQARILEVLAQDERDGVSENFIARKLGLSNDTVRLAVGRLAQRGLVVATDLVWLPDRRQHWLEVNGIKADKTGKEQH